MRLQMHMKVINVVIGCIEVKEVGFCGEKKIPSCLLDESQKKTRDMSEKEKKPVGRVWGWGIRKVAGGGVGWGGRGEEGSREESYRDWGGEGMVWISGKRRETDGGGGERWIGGERSEVEEQEKKERREKLGGIKKRGGKERKGKERKTGGGEKTKRRIEEKRCDTRRGLGDSRIPTSTPLIR